MIWHYWAIGGLTPCGKPVGMFEGHGFTSEWGKVTCTDCLPKSEGVAAPTHLQEFRFTFGVKYSHEPHPFWPGAHPDGWLTVLAVDEDEARTLVRPYIGNIYAFSYPLDRFKEEYHPMGELARITMDGATGSDTLVKRFGPSDPEFYGRASNEVVACRIEGRLKRGNGSDKDAIRELGYEAETYHVECFTEGAGRWASIQQVDHRVLAGELDWADPHECPVCERSLT